MCSHGRAIIKLCIPSIIDDVSNHPEYNRCRTVSVIIYWQRLLSPALQINQVGLRVSPISLPRRLHISAVSHRRQ
nr:MAG TPA: hypothetical protein [Caudoviricetes sp.]